MSLKRKPIQIVEIDIDQCTRTYGSAPCTAVLGTTGVRKCYNTYFTCQDEANFNAGTLTLRFSTNQTGLPKGTVIYPALTGAVSTNPTEINLGGVGDKLGSMGKRARVTVNLKDFKDSDLYTDPYRADRVDGTGQTDEGGYNPQDRGTFFGKLRRRFPYYTGRALRVLEGYEGDALGSMRTRHYIINEWNGPDINGNVSIIAHDILRLADDKLAQVPAPSQGKLETGMDAVSFPTINLLPSGIGSEYSASGRASIGSEIVTFTRSGDAVTITARGIDGSSASAHSAGDVFQECYRVENGTIPDVIADLLENYANVPSSFLPTTDWDDEADRWIPNFIVTRTIPKPIGVKKAIEELLQLGVIIWWDDIAQEVKFRANRPLDIGESAPDLTDATHFIEGMLKNHDRHDKRISRVLFWHGVLDYSDTGKKGENYRRLFVAIDEEAESANEYNETLTYEVFNPWLGSTGDDQVAAAVAVRLVNRYRDAPRELEFDVDVKDEATTRIADLATVCTRAIQDETGNILPVQMQICAVEEIEPGHKLRIKAQEWEFAKRYGFIAPGGLSDYPSVTDDQRRKYVFIANSSQKMSDGTDAYVMF